MTSEFRHLGKVAEVNMGTSPKGHFYNQVGEGVPLLNGPTEFGPIYPEVTLFTSKSIKECEMGDLLFCVRGSTTGRMNWADQRYSIGRGICSIRGKSKLETRFIRYALEDRLPGLLQLAGGGTFPNLPADTIKAFQIPYPDTRTRIASILTMYDDLIENNLRRIKLLEESAGMLYREWFVRLRFPGYEHTRILNGVPEGWEKKKLGDLCDEIRETVAPKEVDPETPYIGLEHMPRRSITLSTWGKAEEVTSLKHKFRVGDILFGKIRPYFHKVGIALVDGVASSDAIVLRPKEDQFASLLLLVASSDRFVAEASQKMKEGSKMPRADWTIMREYAVALPPHGVLDTLNGFVCSITEQLRLLTMQNRKLQQARYILLQKLMSGKVKLDLA